jgi:hypothetical protein
MKFRENKNGLSMKQREKNFVLLKDSLDKKKNSVFSVSYKI